VTNNRSLYKFRAFNKTSIELFVNRELWFARPDSLNDPFECQYNSDTVSPDLDEFLDLPKDKVTELKKVFLELFNSMGICSFSKTQKNQLMWAHYADEHKGFCIEFDESELIKCDPTIRSVDVNYQSKIPCKPLMNKLDNTEFKLSCELDSEVTNSIIGTKYTHWKYEKERRLVLAQSGVLPFSDKSVVSIILGLRMEDRDKDTLKKVLSIMEWHHVKCYQAEKSKGKFGLDFTEIKI